MSTRDTINKTLVFCMLKFVIEARPLKIKFNNNKNPHKYYESFTMLS